VKLRVVGDDGRPLTAGCVGRVQVQSGAVMRRYWRDKEATAAALDRDGWVTVGDLGRLDAVGNLTLVGREGERYVRGGYNVYPAEVERVLADHAGVAEAAVVGIPDPVLGEIGVAYVRPVSRLEVDDLRGWVRERIADYKMPDRIVILDEMPLTSVGKIDRRTLVAWSAPSSSSRPAFDRPCGDR
jgi:acyl-CoA synthetase (AMP-forming)/AMP-acid ligase II